MGRPGSPWVSESDEGSGVRDRRVAVGGGGASEVHPMLPLAYRPARASGIEVMVCEIRLRVSKEPAILHDGDGSGIHERRQLSHRAHKTISRCLELASARQRRRLSARLHTLQLIQVHSSPLATPITSDDPKDTRYPGAGWSPPIRCSDKPVDGPAEWGLAGL